MKALVIEDHSETQEFLSRVLAERGHEVTVCANGRDALQCRKTELHDLILLDRGLPDLDGLEVCRQLRALPDGADSIILIITGRIDPNDLRFGLAAGADDYLTKPVELDVLNLRLAIAERHAQSRRDRRAAESTARREEDALRVAEQHYRQLFENAIEGIYQSSPDGRYLAVNPALARMYGYASPQEMLGSVTDISRQVYVDPALREEFKRLMVQDGIVRGLEYEVRRRDGQTLWLSENARAVKDTAGNVLCYEGILADVTERRSLESQLRQSQKMESVGRLAASVAHDFNNILGIIKGYSSLLQQDAAVPEPVTRSLKHIVTATDRAAVLTRQLLAFSRKQVMMPKPLDLGELMQGLAPMLERLLGASILLKLRTALGTPSVVADGGMLEQVLMNLVVNARDAMPQGGRIVINVGPEAVDDAYVRRNREARPGLFACVSVSDTGTGIPPEVLPRIFEPFFTTKHSGKGTGLGLSTVYGIVKQHEGWVEIYTQAGQGTTFRVLLPARAGTLATQEGADQKVLTRGGDERILLVEDEDALRMMVRESLERLGYTVVESPSGVEALAAWTSARGSFDLLLTDIVMPGGISGKDLAMRLRAKRKRLPIVFISGYNPEALDADLALNDSTRFLAKPFDPGVLAGVVRDCLDSK